LPYIPSEKVTTLTTFLGLIEERRDFTATLAMYMAITGVQGPLFERRHSNCGIVVSRWPEPILSVTGVHL
jgi:hypothetical protein